MNANSGNCVEVVGHLRGLMFLMLVFRARPPVAREQRACQIHDIYLK